MIEIHKNNEQHVKFSPQCIELIQPKYYTHGMGLCYYRHLLNNFMRSSTWKNNKKLGFHLPHVLIVGTHHCDKFISLWGIQVLGGITWCFVLAWLCRAGGFQFFLPNTIITLLWKLVWIYLSRCIRTLYWFTTELVHFCHKLILHIIQCLAHFCLITSNRMLPLQLQTAKELLNCWKLDNLYLQI